MLVPQDPIILRVTVHVEAERVQILLNRKRSEEHRARTHRLIGRGAILEGIFPAVVEMEGEEVKAFLIALSRLPGAAELAEKTQNARDEG